jgi:titin
VAAVDPTEVSYQIPVTGSNPGYSYVYTYSGTGHGGGDTNLYFYLPPAAIPTPLAPSGLTATAVSSSQINLTWVDSDTSEQGFKIERCSGAGCSNFAQIATVGANVTNYSNTGLSGSTSYSYRVRAYNASGDSDYSNPASAVTQAAPTLPAAPTNLVATAIAKSQINLSWADNANNETGFRILRCKGSTCTNFALIATVGANVTSYTNTGLAANTTYRYRVYAYNASGDSGSSNVATATTPRR